MDEIYPYPKDPHEHPLAHTLFNITGIGLSFDACNTVAKHLFDELGCGPPGTTHPPRIKYDALGSSGGPWQPGAWIPMDEPRQAVVVTAPAKDVSKMTPEELAELKAAIQARELAEQAGTLHQGDETSEG